MVLVTSYFRDLASAPKVHWQAGAEAPASEQEPERPNAVNTHTTANTGTVRESKVVS